MGLYSHYDGAHNHPVNRALHMIAIPVGFSSIVVVWFYWIIGLLLIPTAFALAWLGHLIEGNKPAFMTNPVHVFGLAGTEALPHHCEKDCLTLLSFSSQNRVGGVS